MAAGSGAVWLQDAGEGVSPARPSFFQVCRESLENERPRFFLWAPVWLGAGIAVYFALMREPGLLVSMAPAVIFAILLAALSRGTLAAACAGGLLIAGAGFMSAKLRVESVRAPILLIHGFASTHAVNWVFPQWVKTLTRAGRRTAFARYHPGRSRRRR